MTDHVSAGRIQDSERDSAKRRKQTTRLKKTGALESGTPSPVMLVGLRTISVAFPVQEKIIMRRFSLRILTLAFLLSPVMSSFGQDAGDKAPTEKPATKPAPAEAAPA